MAYEITTTIDTDKCTGCGRCAVVCPYNSIEILDGKAVVTGKLSMHCGHCVAACAHGAVSVGDLIYPEPETIEDNKPARTLFSIIQSRRSCRSYRKNPVNEQQLLDLIKFGQWAPSGTNSQKWGFTIVPDRKSVLGFAKIIADFYHKTNKMAENPFLRLFSRLFLNDTLGIYYRRYYKQIKSGLKEWENDKKDILFHGATAAIVISVDNSASCANADAIHAAQNIVLGAHAMKLGTCLIGFAVKAMQKDKTILSRMNIPENHKVYSVIAIGHPGLRFPAVSGRKVVETAYFKL